MKNLNKVLALVIVLAMAISTVAFAGTFTDVTADASYSEAVEVMAALGLLAGYEDGSFGPDKSITRAEFAAVIVRAIGMEDSAKGSFGATNFSDVKADDWFAGYVMIASQQNIVNGYPDGTFKPTKVVKFEEAVKMIICALGYEKKFEDVANAYPTAYIAQAHTAGITTGANLAVGTDASRAIVARLVYNALDVGKMEQTAFGTEKQWAVPTYAETLLSENLNVAKVKGFVTAVGFTAEDADKLTFQVSKNGVAKQYAAENAAYYTSTLDIYNAAGGTLNNLEYADTVAPIKYRSVVAYLDMSDDTNPVVLALVEQAGKNETLAISATQAKDAIFDYANKKVGYYKTSSDIDATQTEVRLADSFKVFVNMNADAETALATVATNYKAGKYPVVELIDNDSSVNGYEIVVVTDYTSGVVSEVSDRSYRVTFDALNGTGAGSIVLNPTAENYTFSIADEAGNAVAFEDIKEDDVLNIFKSTSTNGTYYEVIVTTEKVNGSIAEDLGDGYYLIEGEEYFSLVNLQAGDAGVFFVDMFGKVLDFEIGEDANRSFGVLYAAYIDTNGVDNEPKAIIYTADGKFTTYGFAKNLYTNGSSTTPYTSIAKTTIDSTFSAIGGKDQKLIMYTVNASGLISEIYYGAGINYRDENYEVRADSGKDYSDKTNALNKIYIEEGFTFVTLADAAFTTVSGTGNKDKFGTSTSAILVDDDNTTYDYAMVVNTKTEDVAAFGVLFNCKAKVDAASPVMFVTNTGSAEDSEGSPATRITGYVNNERVSFLVNADTVYYAKNNTTVTGSAADIKKGAMIQYNGAEEADAVRILAKDTDVASFAATTGAWITSTDAEDDDVNGYMYVGSLAEYKRNNATFKAIAPATEGLVFKVNSAVSTAVARGINVVSGSTTIPVSNVYVNDYIGFGIVETDAFVYDAVETIVPATHNNDIVAIYFFDGDATAAMIVDKDGDTAWN